MNEIERILNMVKDGTITPEEGDALIRALKEKESRESNSPCMFKIRIDAGENQEKAKVNVNIPIGVVKALVKATGKFSFKMMGNNDKIKDQLNKYGIEIGDDGKIENIEAFIKAMDELCKNAPLELVNIEAEDNGERAKVYISIE